MLEEETYDLMIYIIIHGKGVELPGKAAKYLDSLSFGQNADGSEA